MNASQNVQVSPNFRRPGKHFRHKPGHQRAGAVLGFNNISHSTIIAVNGVEHQQTVNLQKMGQRTICFSQVLIVFSSMLAVRDTLEDTLTKEIKLHCLGKAHKSRLEKMQSARFDWFLR